MNPGTIKSAADLQELAASALDALPELAIAVDRRGYLLYLNRAARDFAAIRGDASSSGWLGQHCHALFHDGSVEMAACPLCRNIASGEALSMEIETSPGSWYGVSLTPADNHCIQISREVACAKRRTAESGTGVNACESQRIYEAIMRNASDAILVANQEGRFIDVNRRAKELFGYTREEFLAMSPADIHAPGNEQNMRTAFRQMDETGSSLFEHRLVRKDGSAFFAEVSGTRIPWQGGYIYLGSFRDISERKRIDEELTHYRERLEKLVDERTRELRTINRELEAFSYSVSHDLRAPLRAINGFGEALREELGDTLSADGAYFLERMRHATVRMGELIDGLLNLSQVSRSELRVGRVDLSAIAAHVIATLRESDPARVVHFEVEPELVTSGDPTLLQVLLENLLNNAWKFTSKVPNAHIVLARDHGAQGEVFCVRDNGAGFDPQFAHTLFTPFVRLHEGEFRGTGIGLATVRRIVERHGGAVWAEGAPNGGATIYFSLAAKD